MLELKVVLSLVLQTFRLRLPRRIKVDRTGLLLSTPRAGLPMRVSGLDQPFESIDLRGNIRDLIDFPSAERR